MAELVELQSTHFKILSESYLHGGITEARIVETRIKASNMLDTCAESFREAAAEPGLQGWQRSELTRLIRTFARMHRFAHDHVDHYPQGVRRTVAVHC